MLIGLSGPEGAGKSLAAKLLSASLKTPIVPFAGPLKKMLEAAGVPPRNLYGTPADKLEPLPMLCGKSARHAMQTLGTEWRDTIGRDLWLNLWSANAGESAIADDVRFSHEAEAILSRGGCIIRIVRSLADENRQAHHASEAFQSVPFTFRVVNDKCPTLLLQNLTNGLNHWSASRNPAARALTTA